MPIKLSVQVIIARVLIGKTKKENEPNDLLLETDHQIVDSDDDNDEELHEGTLQLYIGRAFNLWEELRTINILTPILKKSISEKSHWSKGYRISKKALNLMIRLNCDNEFLQIMEEIIFSKTHKLELLENEKENDKNVIESQQSVVVNPYVTKCHGRSPKHFKNALENTTNMCQNSQNTKSTVDHIEQYKKKKKCTNCGILIIMLEPVQYN
ncbi:37849_t:CDS:2 [Gigaspora margarita]|uniref:37849_t:CDS:1 n=1 Tax=Gigaspora margarita TaxID=4874 RepID=A0ABN7UDC0_GIGMA|nr:37849_t:CDS:2 [Gigaspora margarita]